MHITLLGEHDAPRLLTLYEATADYHRRVGGAADAAAVAHTLAHPSTRHSDISTDLQHLVYGVCLDENASLDAALAVLFGYPTAATAYIGLLLLRPAVRGQGLGVALLDWLERTSPPGIRTLRLAVHHNNPDAARFWTREGFVLLRGVSLSPDSDVYERARR